jgi:hypothetical protein
MRGTGNDVAAHLARLQAYAATLPGRRGESLATLLLELTPDQSDGARLAVVLAALELLLGTVGRTPIHLPGGGTLDPRALILDPASEPDATRFSLVLADRLSVDFPGTEAAGRFLQA